MKYQAFPPLVLLLLYLLPVPVITVFLVFRICAQSRAADGYGGNIESVEAGKPISAESDSNASTMVVSEKPITVN